VRQPPVCWDRLRQQEDVERDPDCQQDKRGCSPGDEAYEAFEGRNRLRPRSSELPGSAVGETVVTGWVTG